VLAAVILIALHVASIATFALFQVLLPLLFTFIHIPARRARMFEIGRAGQRGLERAREHIRYQFMGGPAPSGLASQHEPEPEPERQPTPPAASKARVATDAPARARVSIDAEAEDLDVEAAPSHDPPRTRRP